MGLLTLELETERTRIEKMARSYGLDYYPVLYEIITYDQMNEFAAQGGFPVRYPHWRFGMEYEKLSKSYEYGLAKIYEMVVNTDPVYAYLMEGNMIVDQKLVMAHVYGHADFFKNNQWFSKTDRKMMDTMANHATRIQRYIDRFGHDAVEDFIDRCLSCESLIDRHGPYFNKKQKFESATIEQTISDRFRDKYYRASDYIGEIRDSLETKKAAHNFVTPPVPEKDILLFLINHAPLELWQQDILSIIRTESYYFAPQAMTKIMNEGWASYWHTTLMTEQVLSDAEIIDYADHHSGTVAMAPMGFNPYKIGLELFRDIEDRWNRGKFGREWEEAQNYEDKNNWNKKLGLGRQKIFEVRRDYNDVMFIDEFLTEDFCVKNKMFVYKFNQRTGEYVVDTRDFKEIKKKFLFQLTNMGQPIVTVVDGNFEGKGELLIGHLYEGVDMQPDYMKETLKNIYAIWQRPVNLKTIMENEEKLYKYDGKEFKETTLGELPTSKEEKSES